jgi:predicted O-methyltransferase YrrM
MIIPISNEILDTFQLKNHEYMVNSNYYVNKSGDQEYRLYSYLSTFFNHSIILDVGTLTGRSAIALSHNNSNQVISYDINDYIGDINHKLFTKSNIKFHLKDVFEDLTEDFVKKLSIVMIDVDHYETFERRLIDKLKELKFSGIIILDDITGHPDPKVKECMQRLWDGITDEKYDFTKYAHWSGTGVILINTDIQFKFD